MQRLLFSLLFCFPLCLFGQVQDTTTARIYLDSAKVLSEAAKYDEALQLNRKALTIYKNTVGEMDTLTAKAYNAISYVFFEYQQTDSLFFYANKVETIFKHLKIDSHVYLSLAYSFLGSAYYYEGDWDNVLKYDEKTLQIRLQLFGKNHPLIAKSYNNLGTIYERKKQYNKAGEYFKKTLKIRLDLYGEMHLSTSTSYNTLGAISYYKQLYDEAIEYYTKALKIRLIHLGNKHPLVSDSYKNLAITYDKKGLLNKAVKYHIKALDIIVPKLGEKHPLVLQYYCLYSKILIKQKKWHLAYIYLQKTAIILGYNPNKSTALLGTSHQTLLENYFPVLQSYYHTLYQVTQEEVYSDSLLLTYRNHMVLLDYFQEKFSQESILSHIEQAFPLYEAAIKHILHRNKKEELTEVFEIAEKSKSRLLVQGFRKSKVQTYASMLDNLFEKVDSLNVKITLTEKQLYEEKIENKIPNDSLITVYSDNIFTLKREKDKLLENIQKDYPNYYHFKHDHQVVSVKEVQNLLEEDQGILEYFVGDSSIFIFVITKEGFHVEAVEKDFPLEEHIKTLREDIYTYWILRNQSDAQYAQSVRSYTKTAHDLYQKLINPVKNWLPKRIIIVPDGTLSLVPFEILLSALPKEEGDYQSYDYLLKDHAISYNYSATLYKYLLEQSLQKASKKLLAFAPSFQEEALAIRSTENLRNGLPALEFTTSEVSSIKNIIGGDAVIGLDATEEQFFNMAGDYQILHLATHAKTNDKNSDYSFIAFTEIQDSIKDNERLYASELYNLKLSAEMVVLSACETGLGEMKRGEGLQSLARGFTYAGAKSTITSLWAVNDASTSKLMKTFYTYLQQGMPKDQALQKAKLEYLDRAMISDPYFWAGLIAMGNVESIKFQNNFTYWYYYISIFLASSIFLGIFIWKKRK